ncbi:uncharacterized protein FIBRA_04631 [Fibroporia radiculosa]|uniref:Uncharacterized protein n=1 Tax=Fibroporia radiculosa TaxID=599839 RepID=J4H324_9APHY|nr:uncharacterized protein FIBRA_04631 [Fibroporia radiculosa]CCM02529.1 predicted protein [Fibroporia radiculosa]
MRFAWFAPMLLASIVVAIKPATVRVPRDVLHDLKTIAHDVGSSVAIARARQARQAFPEDLFDHLALDDSLDIPVPQNSAPGSPFF